MIKAFGPDKISTSYNDELLGLVKMINCEYESVRMTLYSQSE